VPYVADLGYTHVELLPITEHPLDESWGYQTTGYFAATARYGSPQELRALIDAFHRAGIGVILDWVPAHFPMDRWALARFDGTALYEHEDPRMGLHQDRDEEDFSAPVVSLSLGDSCLFRIGGTKRNDPTRSFKLASGDAMVLGGEARLAFHGVDRIIPGTSTLLPEGGRINVTMRRVTRPG